MPPSTPARRTPERNLCCEGARHTHRGPRKEWSRCAPPTLIRCEESASYGLSPPCSTRLRGGGGGGGFPGFFPLNSIRRPAGGHFGKYFSEGAFAHGSSQRTCGLARALNRRLLDAPCLQPSVVGTHLGAPERLRQDHLQRTGRRTSNPKQTDPLNERIGVISRKTLVQIKKPIIDHFHRNIAV